MCEICSTLELMEAGVSALCCEKIGNRMKLWHGNMNLKSLAKQAKQIGIDAVILESHKNWVDKSPVKSLEVNAKWLNGVF